MRALIAVCCLSLLPVGFARADSLNVRRVGHCGTPSTARGVAVAGDYAYIAGYFAGLRVISVADPEHPSDVGHLDLGLASTVAANGDHAYVGVNGYGLKVVSIFDPLHPVEVGSITMTSEPAGLFAEGGYVYVADYDSGLRVISVSDPANPVEVGHCSTPSFCLCVAVVGDYAYAGDNDSGLVVISVADPAHPVEVGHCSTAGGARSVAVVGSYAYVVCGAGGFRVISVSDPTHPSEVCRSGPGLANAVDVDGDKAYVGADVGGLRVISVSDPAHPVEVGFYSLPEGVSGVVVAGEYTYLANTWDGLQILQYYESGVEENSKPQALGRALTATVNRSLPPGAVAFDAMGRRVVNPRPGVLFVRERSAVGGERSAVIRKVVVTR